MEMVVRDQERHAAGKWVPSAVGVTKEDHDDNCHIYRDASEVIAAFCDRKPMSVVRLHDGAFGCMVSDGMMVQLTCGVHVSDINGCTYHRWELPFNKSVVMEDASPNGIAHYCLILPQLQATGLPPPHSDALYTTITSEWLEIGPDKGFRDPTFTSEDKL